jgi:thiamine-phosphate diphosphorylase
VGVSATTAREATLARRAGADYIGIGPVYRTATKPDAADPIGLQALREICRGIPELPGVAIGGVDAERAAAVLSAGARYVAVISAVCHADDPLAALERMVEVTEQHGTETTG